MDTDREERCVSTLQVSKRENFKSEKLRFVVAEVAAKARAALLLCCGCCPPLALWLLHSSRVEFSMILSCSHGHAPLMQRWPRSSCAEMAALLSYISKQCPRTSPFNRRPWHSPLSRLQPHPLDIEDSILLSHGSGHTPLILVAALLSHGVSHTPLMK